MHVFISDVHFGRSDYDSERVVEQDLVGLLRQIRPDVERLFLLGDIFEFFVEYRHSVPKGFSRFMGLVAEWTDAGIPVSYFVGNHDPWHRDYFEHELGASVHRSGRLEILDDLRVFIDHGDGLGQRDRSGRWLKPILRHPVPVGLYTGLLPSDVGLGIAKWYSRTFRKSRTDPARVADLRESARNLLRTKEADLVILAHSHVAEFEQWPEGAYMNPGCWFEDRTFGVLDQGRPTIARWNGRTIEPYRT
jgi:UDP-2,3-diacylglucosamine hydrolase